MIKLPFNLTDITRNFAEHYAQRGKTLYEKQCVHQLEVDAEGLHINARVQETPDISYHVSIDVQKRYQQVILSGQCDCALGFNCSHVIATLYQALQDQLALDTEMRAQQWLNEMDRALAVQAPAEDEATLLYVLRLKDKTLQVELIWGRQLKKGGYGKLQAITEHKDLRYLLPLDQNLMNALQRYGQTLQLGLYDLDPRHVQHVVEQLVVTGRAFWTSVQSQPLTLGPEREAQYEWQTAEEGMQQLTWRIAGCNAQIIPSMPPMYIDLSHYEFGVLQTHLRDDLAALLVNAPLFSETQAATIRKAFKQPRLPQQASVHVTPIPHVRLQALAPQQLPVVDVSFNYWGNHVSFNEPEKCVTLLRDNHVVVVARDEQVERQTREQLLALGLEPLPYSRGRYLWLGAESELQQQLWVLRKVVDYALEQGWPLSIDADFPLQWETKAVDWYSQVEAKGHQIDWFDLELGVMVDGEQLNLLPILADTLQSYKDEASAIAQSKLFCGDTFYVRLPNGRYLGLPTEKVQQVLHIFSELWDPQNLEQAQLLLPKFRSGDLIRLENTLNITLDWRDNKELKTLARQLFKEHKTTKVEQPAGFNAQLRPYQLQGLMWLKALTKHHCGGILADDMGLGKTVQTLALLLLEKEHGHLHKPSLIVAPTSLMTNWHYEAQRFAPDLKVLVLHGAQRKTQFKHIKEYDVVLTTYALLVRDEAVLVEQEYQFLILDEAQIIKNPQSKASKVLTGLNAKQRFCLTGTPVENHLGELWSLFNFLLPGLLGTQKQFKRIFQLPIERLDDSERAMELAQRTMPFILRRTKAEVTPELPPKTEIIRPIELEEKQRELYEKVRLRVRSKVDAALSEQGLARSHIVVLDALLKLRQICCDPRLAKIADDTNIASAKLNLLLELLPNLIEEGRRILVFSSFASMLDLIEDALQKKDIAFVKLTGKTQKRAQVIQRFQDGEVPVFLISLKAGGLGLNLTAADTVIHYDPWWNPAAEQQATDRAHRIGQDKPVFVYKFITLGTVEEKIVALQEHKKALIDNLFAQQKSLGKMSLTDIDTLLGPLA